MSHIRIPIRIRIRCWHWALRLPLRRLRFRHVTLLCRLSHSSRPHSLPLFLRRLSLFSFCFVLCSFYSIFTCFAHFCCLIVACFCAISVFSFFLRLFHVSYFTACVLRQCVQQQSTILNGSESPSTSASPTLSTSDSASVSVSLSSTLMRLKRQFSWNR